jgi:hypothetical protein
MKLFSEQMQDEKIIYGTPVDGGRARGNWQATLGSPATGEVATFDRDGASTLAGAVAMAGQAAGNVFYLTNNLPYIRTLEYGMYGTGPGATVKTTRDGYSIQAPYGMVRVSVQSVRNSIDQVIREAANA